MSTRENIRLIARAPFGLEMKRLPVQASPEALCSEREREKEREAC